MLIQSNSALKDKNEYQIIDLKHLKKMDDRIKRQLIKECEQAQSLETVAKKYGFLGTVVLAEFFHTHLAVKQNNPVVAEPKKKEMPVYESLLDEDHTIEKIQLAKKKSGMIYLKITLMNGKTIAKTIDKLSALEKKMIKDGKKFVEMYKYKKCHLHGNDLAYFKKWSCYLENRESLDPYLLNQEPSEYGNINFKEFDDFYANLIRENYFRIFRDINNPNMDAKTFITRVGCLTRAFTEKRLPQESSEVKLYCPYTALLANATSTIFDVILEDDQVKVITFGGRKITWRENSKKRRYFLYKELHQEFMVFYENVMKQNLSLEQMPIQFQTYWDRMSTFEQNYSKMTDLMKNYSFRIFLDNHPAYFEKIIHQGITKESAEAEQDYSLEDLDFAFNIKGLQTGIITSFERNGDELVITNLMGEAQKRNATLVSELQKARTKIQIGIQLVVNELKQNPQIIDVISDTLKKVLLKSMRFDKNCRALCYFGGENLIWEAEVFEQLSTMDETFHYQNREYHLPDFQYFPQMGATIRKANNVESIRQGLYYKTLLDGLKNFTSASEASVYVMNELSQIVASIEEKYSEFALTELPDIVQTYYQNAKYFLENASSYEQFEDFDLLMPIWTKTKRR